MIKYDRRCIYTPCRLFQLRGSVFPTAFLTALPCGAVTVLLKYCIDEGWLPSLSEDGSRSILKDNSCWSGLTYLVGFLIVFRTSQAYAKFWDGCTSIHHMRAEWFDSCASLIAFCKCSDAASEDILGFQHILVRLFSILHAVALADIEDSNSDDPDEVEAFKYELVDGEGLDAESLNTIKRSPAKVELVFQWIQQLIVENLHSGVIQIPPPILSRSFQEIANGMVAFHEAMKISSIPFPFPYAQTCECLLMFHLCVTPLVVSQYVSGPGWGGLFSFLQVFVYWSLNAIAVELENPFGMDANDLDASLMQKELNGHLLLLLDPATKRTPRLTRPIKSGSILADKPKASLAEIWDKVGGLGPGKRGRPTRRSVMVAAGTSLSAAGAQHFAEGRASAVSAVSGVSFSSAGCFARDSALSVDGKLSQDSDAACSDRASHTGSKEILSSDSPRNADDVHLEGPSLWSSAEAELTVQSEFGVTCPHTAGHHAPGAKMKSSDELAARDVWKTQQAGHCPSCTEPHCEHALHPEDPLQAHPQIRQSSAEPVEKCGSAQSLR